MESVKSQLETTGGTTVTAELLIPNQVEAILVLAHGAGAGIYHKFMQQLAEALVSLNLVVYRFNFPYLEKGRKLPGNPAADKKTILSAVDFVRKNFTGIPIFLAGKSYGGRMASHVVADQHVEDLAGLIFYGFPLHSSGKPSMKRANHLDQIRIPMLFLQGEKDALADLNLVEILVKHLNTNVKLIGFPDANHAFHCPAKTGISDQEMVIKLANASKSWIKALILP